MQLKAKAELSFSCNNKFLYISLVDYLHIYLDLYFILVYVRLAAACNFVHVKF